MTTSVAPTDAQIAQVRANLKALQSLNDYVYNHSNALVMNAYFLMSEKDEDPGLALGLNLFEGVLWAFCSYFGAIGNFAAGFLGGMMGTWMTDPPPNLNTTFAKMIERLEATSIAVDQQLATYYQNPASYWNTSHTFQGVTGTLADLSSISLPTETDPSFEDVARAGLTALDHSLWASVLQTNFVVTTFVPQPGYGQNYPNPFWLPGPQDAFPADLADAYIARYPSYYLVPIGWRGAVGCGGSPEWFCQAYNLGTGVTGVSDGALSKDACTYLFKNYYSDTIVNPGALYDRKAVFNSLNIPTASVGYNWGAGPQSMGLSTKYKQAMVDGGTLGALAAKEGRSNLEARIIKKAQEDHVFAMRLGLNPREALEEFLGVAIPETLGLNVVIERGNTYSMVVPRKELPTPRAPQK